MISKSLKILIVGSQGSGKTTQSRLLAEFLCVPFIETGAILRKLSKEETAEGREIKGRLDAGEMVSDEIVAEIVRKRIREEDCINGFVMNGFPRNLYQIQLFDPGFDKVFYLELTDELVLDRLLKRGREDDTKELIEKRLSDYHSLTEPILNYYRSLEILETVDGAGTKEVIQDKIRSCLNG